MTTKEVATTQAADLTIDEDFLNEVALEDNLGYSQKAEDSLIPIVGILQDNSGEVKKKHSRYFEGAEAGDLIIRSLARLFKVDDEGDSTMVFQPCAFQHVWVEWQGEPGSGAPVNQYPFEERPEDAVEKPQQENPDRMEWRMPNGNRLVDTRYHYGNILTDDGLLPAVIPMSGTNHTISRQWTAQMKQFRIPGRSNKAPSFFHAYKISTVFRQNGEQSWYTFKINHLMPITDRAILEEGLSLMRAVDANEVRADAESDVAAEASSDDTPI